MLFKILFFITGICISCFLFFADDFLTVRHFNPSLPPLSSPNSSTLSPLPEKTLPIPLDDAVLLLFPNAQIRPLPDTMLLFEKYSLTVSGVPLSFFQKEYLLDGKNLFTVFSVTLPQKQSEELESIQVLTQIQATAQTIDINTYGKKSFVIRLEEHQQMMYIVIVFENRLLGISSDITDVLRFKTISQVLKKAFPPIL